jgi:Holliday junction resolvase
MEERSMSGRHSRNKGLAFERDCVKLFKQAMPGEDIKRGLQSRGGGAEVPDVDMPVFHIECKVGKKPNIRAAYEQASRDTQGKIPVAIVKDDRKEPLVVMGLTNYMNLIAEWWEGE